MRAARVADERWYIAVLFVSSYLWQWLVYSTGGVDSSFLPLMMFLPALVAILFMRLSREPLGDVGWGLTRARLLPVAFLVPILVTLLAIGILSLAGWASWSNEIFSFSQGQVDVRKVTLVLGKGIQSTGFFALNLLLTMMLQSVPGSVLTLGEEIGWRGYLQKKLTDRHGRAKGVILLGLVWGYWHLPIVLMGYNFPSQPVLGGLLLMPLGSICIGLFLSLLYLRSHSVWLPTLGHTSVNLSAGLLYAGMTARGDQVVIPLVFIAVWAIVGAICLASIGGADHGDSERERNAVGRVRDRHHPR